MAEISRANQPPSQAPVLRSIANSIEPMFPSAADLLRGMAKQASPEITGQTSDGYHTFDELYEFRMLYHAAFVNAWEILGTIHDPYPAFPADPPVSSVKSQRHSDGEECFGGGWFIVVTQLPTGQISNHYEMGNWNLFQVPEVETAPEFDGHTPNDVLNRLQAYLLGESNG